MSRVIALLGEMRGRLGMYIGVPSLTRLAAFLRGYDHALVQHGLGDPDRFLGEFRDWIHKHYRSSACSWEDAILQDSADDAEAIKRFWELLDKYLEQSKGNPGFPPVHAMEPKEQLR
jgi:hypothetical protein